MSEDLTTSTPTPVPPAPSTSALAQLLAQLDAVDSTLDVVARRIPHGIADAPRGLAADARTIAAAVARLQAQAATAQRNIPRLEAQRDQLEAAVQTAGVVHSSLEAKAARQRLEEERGRTQVHLEEAKRRLTELTNV